MLPDSVAGSYPQSTWLISSVLHNLSLLLLAVFSLEVILVFSQTSLSPLWFNSYSSHCWRGPGLSSHLHCLFLFLFFLSCWLQIIPLFYHVHSSLDFILNFMTSDAVYRLLSPSCTTTTPPPAPQTPDLCIHRLPWYFHLEGCLLGTSHSICPKPISSSSRFLLIEDNLFLKLVKIKKSLSHP